MKLADRMFESFHKARASLFRVEVNLVPTEDQRLFALSIVIGVACGLAAVAFHLAIRLVESLLIDRAVSAPGHSWIVWTLLTPTAGALLCGALLCYIVPNARGSGIPQVKITYTLKGGQLRLRDSVGKFFVGALQIGSGSSLGREGPTVQICSGIASALGRLAKISPRNLRRLLPVGAAAGVSAAFNAPIAAVTFTIEEIVGDLDQTVLSGVIVAAAFADIVERALLGAHPVFDLPRDPALGSLWSLLLYVALGVTAAKISVLFTDSLLFLRGWFRRRAHIPEWVRPGIGGLITGVLAIIALLIFHQSGVTGGGYEALVKALAGKLGVVVMLSLCVMKLVATSFSYGSGGAGGIFAPSLFIGGMLGGAFGVLDVWLLHEPESVVGSFALAGMGAVFAGTIRAPITSVLIIIEMTDGYELILPLMLANMSAYTLARVWRPMPIYEALLEQDGFRLPRQVNDPLQNTALSALIVREREFIWFSPGTSLTEILQRVTTATWQDVYPVLDESARSVGMFTRKSLVTLKSDAKLAGAVAQDLMESPITISEEEAPRTAYKLICTNGFRELIVVDDKSQIVGFINETEIAQAYLRASTKDEA